MIRKIVMFGRSGLKYERTDAGETEAQQTRVRVAAARNCIRRFKSCSVMSPEWVSLVETIEQLGRLSQMETSMTETKGVDEQEGRTEGDGTLWDQAAHEETIRVLVEEAKVNLCLRMINDFKKWDYDERDRADKLAKAAQRYSCDEVQLERHAHIFEDNLGLLLVRAFGHVETLQLTDIPLLLEHIHMVLQHCEVAATGYSAKSQEKVVLYYFASVLTYAEELNTAEILGRLKDLDLLRMMTKHLKADTYCANDTLGTVVEGYARLCENEDFQTDWESFFPTPEHIEDFLYMDKIAQKVLSNAEDKKASIRPLLDFLLKLGRRAK